MSDIYMPFHTLSASDQIGRWENVLRVLNNLSPHEREKHWLMSSWGFETDCGTVACAAGHCGLDPWFREQGFKLDFVNGHHSIGEGYVANFFGSRGTGWIFFEC